MGHLPNSFFYNFCFCPNNECVSSILKEGTPWDFTSFPISNTRIFNLNINHNKYAKKKPKKIKEGKPFWNAQRNKMFLIPPRMFYIFPTFLLKKFLIFFAFRLSELHETWSRLVSIRIYFHPKWYKLHKAAFSPQRTQPTLGFIQRRGYPKVSFHINQKQVIFSVSPLLH